MLLQLHRACAKLALTLLLGPAAQAQPAPLLSDMLWPVGARQAAISPDGAHVAVVESVGTLQRVTLVKTEDLSSRVIIEGRLARDGNVPFNKSPRRVTWITPSVIAVDYGRLAQAHDLAGKVVSQLGARVLGKAVPGDAASPLVVVYDDWKGETLALVNTQTQHSRTLRYPMSGRPLDWTFDEQGTLRGVLLADTSFWRDDTTLTHWYLPPDQETWVPLETFKVTDESFTPLTASSRSGELTVRSRRGRDTYAVFRYDTTRRALGEVLAGHPTEDVAATAEPATGRLLRVHTDGMKPQQRWLDDDWLQVQVAVDQVLAGRINILSGQHDGQVLVHSYSDLDPGRWYLLDVPKTRLRLLAVSRPRLANHTMRPMEVMHYAASDGLLIPAYLTRPAGPAGQRPAVVMVHGGPAERDRWGWDLEVQLLAAQGYVVLQPQFRGSAGFGQGFEAAGHRQWGLAMQDDITAGVQALVAQGIADPARICIYGVSYGGYAAVWGLIKTPTLFRCGVTLAGPSDLDHLLSDWSDRNDNKLVRELQRHRIGHRERDAARLQAVSPLRHLQPLQAPLLIAHGDDDLRVPISHSKRLMAAMDKAGKTYEWLPLPGEGHGTTTLAGQAAFLDRLLKFLDKHLNPAAPASALRTAAPR